MRRLLLLSSLILVACDRLGGCPMQFERFNGADHAVARIEGKPLIEISSPERLRDIAAFAQKHSSWWHVPWYGTPVARLDLEIYAGGKFLGDLGIGTSFLTAQGCDDFQSRGVGAADREALIALIGVGDPYADRKP